jgi:predicted regulator of Ras-like GTPase activity (Roadblock/LC7/MglB family)
MQTEAQVSTIIETIAGEVPGFIGAALVDLDSGITLGVYTIRDDFDLASASAYNSEIVKQKQKVMGALQLNMELEDITMTLSEQIHMIQVVSPGVFLYLAADRSQANLALVRNAINRHAAERAA